MLDKKEIKSQAWSLLLEGKTKPEILDLFLEQNMTRESLEAILDDFPDHLTKTKKRLFVINDLLIMGQILILSVCWLSYFQRSDLWWIVFIVCFGLKFHAGLRRGTFGHYGLTNIALITIFFALAIESQAFSEEDKGRIVFRVLFLLNEATLVLNNYLHFHSIKSLFKSWLEFKNQIIFLVPKEKEMKIQVEKILKDGRSKQEVMNILSEESEKELLESVLVDIPLRISKFQNGLLLLNSIMFYGQFIIFLLLGCFYFEKFALWFGIILSYILVILFLKRDIHKGYLSSLILTNMILIFMPLPILLEYRSFPATEFSTDIFRVLLLLSLSLIILNIYLLIGLHSFRFLTKKWDE